MAKVNKIEAARTASKNRLATAIWKLDGQEIEFCYDTVAAVKIREETGKSLSTGINELIELDVLPYVMYWGLVDKTGHSVEEFMEIMCPGVALDFTKNVLNPLWLNPLKPAARSSEPPDSDSQA